MSVMVPSGPLFRYGLSVAAVVLALLLTALFQPFLDRSLFLLFFGAVIISAWFGGMGPGLLAIGLSSAACQYFLLHPVGTEIVNASPDLLTLLVFGLVSLIATALISARLRTDQALRASEAQMRRLVSSNIVGIIHSHFDGRILDANDAFLAMVGYTRADLRSGTVRWDAMTPPELRHLSERAMEKLRASGACPPFEKEYFRKDSSRVPVLIGLALLEGTQDQAMCFVLDLSEGKRMEEALKQIRDHLEVRVREQTAALRHMNEALKGEIDEHKRAEEALRLSEQRFRYLAENMDEVFWFTQVNPERTLYVSPAFETVWGRAVNDVYEDPRLWLQCIHPEDRVRVTDAFEAWLNGQAEMYDIEYRILTPPDEVRWIHDRGVKEEKEGRPVLVGGIATDITERKRAEEALRESEARLKLAQESAGAGVWDWDIRSRTMKWSKEYYRLLGLKLGEHQPSHEAWLRSVHPDDRLRVQCAVEEAIKEKRELEIEYRICRPDGELRWLTRRGQTFHDHDGQPARMVGITLDITDRKRGELLLEGEKRLLEMVARGDSLAVILDALCRVVEELSNGLLASILLLDRYGKRLWHAAAPSLPKSYTDTINGMAIGPAAGSCGTAAYRAQRVVVPDITKSQLWAEYRDLGLAHGLRACWATPILSTEGPVLGAFAIYYREPRRPTPHEIDLVERATYLARVTIERKRVEEALSTMQSELARASRAMTMGELIASIAHEINQPLAAIVTNGNACLRWLSGPKPNIKELREAVADVVKDANRASDVIARIRELLKKSPPQAVRLDMNKVIREVAALVDKDVLRRRVSLRTVLASNLPSLSGDRIQLQQVLLNLVMNAVEAMSMVPETGRELVIQSSAHGSNEVLVQVRDAGIGLDPINLDRIFDPFFTTKTNGMGMGLSISRSIIEAHGGKLEASPNADRGANFHFTLPAE